MLQVNDQLIRELFDEMVKHKPVLSRHLVIDDDDDAEEDIDSRVLADQIVKNFPWPIGVELRRLFSGERRELEKMAKGYRQKLSSHQLSVS